MDIDLATLPDDVATLQRMVHSLAAERTASPQHRPRSSGFISSSRICSAASLAGGLNGWTTASCNSASKTSVPILRGSKLRCRR
jgi:hypothetical protein